MNKILNILLLLLSLLVLWINATSIICWAKNPKLTKMEVFLKIPKNIILQFDSIDYD
jgi:hypothetical protein